MILMDALSQRIIFHAWVDKESYANLHPLLLDLKAKGLHPRFATMDGHLKVMRAFKETWPNLTIQRCLYHIQRQGLSWLRTYPKTEAGKELRRLLLTLIPIQSFKDQSTFLEAFDHWLLRHQSFVKSLPSTSVAFTDLKRTTALIQNALPDMFHYLKDRFIEPTTNKLESFYSRLKADIRRHRGLSKEHKQAYLHWYCYFKNRTRNINTF